MEMLAVNLRFPEGPVMMVDGSIVVVEMAAGKITRVSGDGTTSTLAVTGGGPNGLAFGPDGALYCCNNGGSEYRPGHFLGVGPAKDYTGGSIQRIDVRNGEVRTLYDRCGSERLSAPNDIVFDRSGGFYFTDTGKRHHRHRVLGTLYYALPDGSRIVEVAFPLISPNGIGLSPDERTIYVAETDTARLWAFDVVEPGIVAKRPFPSPHGGRFIAGLPTFCRFDSLALEASGNICVGTLVNSEITVFAPDGQIVRRVAVPDLYPTNLCFGGPGLKTAYLTLSETGRLCRLPWAEPGLRLNFDPTVCKA